MGTRRSKHNKGRKPLYKEHGTETIRHWDADEGVVEKRKLIPHVRNRTINVKPAPDIGLEAKVAAYLERRRAIAARKETDQQFPQRWNETPERISVVLPDWRAAEEVEPSRRDILMELFVERKITGSQLHIGRRWQSDRERATIQPNKSIDWSRPIAGAYSTRDINDAQWSAMRRRRNFIDQAGASTATLLDFCLEVDRGRDDLMKTFRVSACQVDAMVEDLIEKLQSFFGEHNARRTEH